MSEPQPVTEVWAYAGYRLASGNKLVGAWHADAGRDPESMWYPKDRVRPVLGGIYDVQVVRAGERVTRHGQPVWTGRTVDDQQRLRWAVSDSGARQRQQAARDHANAAKADALDEAVRPLAALYRACRTRTEREALIAAVLRRITDGAQR